ncbi:MAG: polyribonucleotide nucleotidyltransferase [Acidimicrobiia bacterium]
MSRRMSVEYRQGEASYVLETGRYALQADGAVTVTVGKTQVLVTAVASKTPRADIDFFPLLVDFEERMYAVGRIPGSFFRREGRPTEGAILAARLVDRSLRPNFSEDIRNDIHIVATILAVDLKQPADVPAMNGASAALMISGIPFEGPVGAVRLAYIDGQWVPAPTYDQIEESTFEIVVAGKKVGDDIQIVMVEAGAPAESFARIEQGKPGCDEKALAEGLEAAKPHIEASIAVQNQLREMVSPEPKDLPRVPPYSAEVFEAVESAYSSRVAEVIRISDKKQRTEAETALVEEARTELGTRFEGKESEISNALRSLIKKQVRRRILEEGLRIDGRRPDEVRPIYCEVGIVPRAHGSGLFQRGETQVLNIATLGMLHLVQQLDTLSPEETKRYMHHYYFPPFSTGEAYPIRGPRRREIGHGALAERALLPVIPSQDELPYALRLVSEVLSSNGSTSMASVCASTLSLLDAGIHIKAPIGGVAMGLIYDGSNHVTLTDILGAEDAFGDMDFKVAGSRDYLTALQLDTKIGGIPIEVLSSAVEQAKDARLLILDKMAEVMPAPREELSEHAPRVITLKIPTDKIGDVIGPKGKVITEIQNETGTEVTVENDGTVFVGSTSLKAVEEAVKIIESIVYPPAPELGKRYRGVVVSTTKFGAFVNFLPGKDGLIHISKLGKGRRIARVEDVLSIGDEIDVEVVEIDEQGRVSLDPVGLEERETATSEEGGNGGAANSIAPSSEEAATRVGQPSSASSGELSATREGLHAKAQSGIAGQGGEGQEVGADTEAGAGTGEVFTTAYSASQEPEETDWEGDTRAEGAEVSARAGRVGEAITGEGDRTEQLRSEQPRRLKKEMANFEDYFDQIAEETWGALGPRPRSARRDRGERSQQESKSRGGQRSGGPRERQRGSQPRQKKRPPKRGRI